MKVLAIETSTSVCAAGVIENGNLRSERSLNEPHIHSERLISIIDEALTIAGLSVEKLDGVAVSIGPGSFTGLRIGLSVAKGIAYASAKPLIAVPTLKALAISAIQQNLLRRKELIVPMIDARRNEVYLTAYRSVSGRLEEIAAVQAVVLEKFKDIFLEESEILVMGDGADKLQQFLLKIDLDYGSRVRVPPLEQRLCRASAVGLLGEDMLTRGDIADIASLEPLYVKDFQTLVRTQHLTVH